MLEPNCRKVVETKNLWSIAIDFMKNIDDKLMEFNLKFAYIRTRQDITRAMKDVMQTILKAL